MFRDACTSGRILWQYLRKDFGLRRRALAYLMAARESKASTLELERLAREDFAASSLHDCHAPLWLEHDPGFAEKWGKPGRLRKRNELAVQVVFAYTS